jgi:16S rRNA G1207 methylase RsmC
MNLGEELDSLVFRRVTYRYRKHSFQFDLSQSLFSSAGVDGGTQLLLGMLAEEADLPGYDRFVDVGCGTGTLGIALAGSSERPLVAVDRDARAVAFTERNAALNGLARIAPEVALGMPGYEGDGRELVASNLPAKAGAPVLRLLVRRIARRSSVCGGRAALVIVKPLADFVAAELESIAASIVAERRTANHAAVVFECPLPPEDDRDGADDAAELASEYIRTIAHFQGPAAVYEMATVYNLPEFDGLSFRTALAFDLLRANRVGGQALLYGCGQGHLAVGIGQRAGHDVRITLADRDLLALRATAGNAARNGVPVAAALPVATPAHLAGALPAGTVDWLVVDDDPTPGSRWNRQIIDLAQRLLGEQGKLLVVSRSTTVGRLERESGSVFKEVAGRRMHGFRASLLRLRR